LKVVHVPFTFAPDPVGGTEIYVEALARGLRCHGIEPLVAAPCGTGADMAYEHHGLRVRRFPAASESKSMLRELYGGGDPVAAAAFAQILDDERPDVVHLHAFTRAVSVRLVRAAKRRGFPVFFTYHTPTVSCQRGTLMFRGKAICDGALRVRRCAACSLERRGLPPLAAVLASHVPVPFARALERADLSGGMWTALRMPELMRTQHAAFRVMMEEVDGVVALTDWVRSLLLRNGVPAAKITVSRHGLPGGAPDEGKPPIDVTATPLRVAFLGRADRVKGADTLIAAARAAPDVDIELHLYGVSQSAADAEYWAMLARSAAHDARIALLPPVPHDRIVALLRTYHLLAVPSRTLETGPLVVLESFAAGTPVIGAGLGGIADWVRNGDNGLLVECEDVAGWAAALRRCAADRRLLARLRRGAVPPRGMAEVAAEMARLYCAYFDSAEHSQSSKVTA
jgi:glycosyltransferase involved in cell wall biosynthesis